MARIYSFDAAERASQRAIKADRELARAAANGDRQAFRSIVESNKQRMFTLAQSVLEDASSADDAVQEAFIKAYRALPGFRGQARLSTWLHRITYLTAIDMLRKRTRQQRLAGDDPEADVADTAPASRGERQLESQQLGQRIEHAMLSLSDLEKSVFNLRHRQDFKLREIARILDRSEGTVKNVLFRAIRKMRDQLSDTLTDMQEIERC